MDIRVVFARNLKRYRENRGLTQAALAAAMDVDRAHVSAMERGQQNVTLLTLGKVADHL
ncbi:MAG: XRE family transcriptional regulator, partial [Rhodobacteraceae bacterium]